MTVRWGRPLAVAGAAGVVVASFLPLARSGAATRNSYEVVAAAERLEVVTGALAGVARGWYLVPLLAVGVAAAATRGARGALLVPCVILCVATTALCVVVGRSSLPTSPVVALLPSAGAMALLGAGRHVWEQRNHGRTGRRHD